MDKKLLHAKLEDFIDDILGDIEPEEVKAYVEEIRKHVDEYCDYALAMQEALEK